MWRVPAASTLSWHSKRLRVVAMAGGVRHIRAGGWRPASGWTRKPAYRRVVQFGSTTVFGTVCCRFESCLACGPVSCRLGRQADARGRRCVVHVRRTTIYAGGPMAGRRSPKPQTVVRFYPGVRFRFRSGRYPWPMAPPIRGPPVGSAQAAGWVDRHPVRGVAQMAER